MSAEETITPVIRRIKSLLFIQNEELPFPTTSPLLAVKDFIEMNCNRVNYGHSRLKNLWVYEVKDINGFDPSYLSHIQAIRQARNTGQIHLSDALESIMSTLIKPTDDEEEDVILECPKPQSFTPIPSKKAKILDYFKFVPKEPSHLATTSSNQYFMPVQPKPNTTVKISAANLDRNPTGYVAKCWHDLERFSIMKLKLLQFGEDYRPSYFGMAITLFLRYLEQEESDYNWETTICERFRIS